MGSRATAQGQADMGIIIAFLLGVGNFAAQRAVMECGHPMLTQMSPGALRIGKSASLTVEFGLLVAALYAATEGLSGWLWLYFAYSAANLFAAWLISGQRY